MVFYEDLIISKENLEEIDFREGEFYNCTFSNLDLSERDLREGTFENCSFKNVRLNNNKLDGVRFLGVVFLDSELISLNFTKINQFVIDINIENSYLKYCNFSDLNLGKMKIQSSSLIESICFQTNFEKGSFKGTDLNGTTFDRCNLEKVDFRGSENYTINLNENKIKGAIFSEDGLAGLLKNFEIKIK